MAVGAFPTAILSFLNCGITDQPGATAESNLKANADGVKKITRGCLKGKAL